jgi:tRNA nucleotidyltransferase/poly(A) polymerase
VKKLIKNYTTDIPVERTVAEIQKILAENGARGIALEYDQDGTIKDIFFKITLHGKELAFRLPAKPDHVYTAVFADMQYQERLRQERLKKAEAIAWRICKTWLEAQITLINLEQAKLEEVFLPYLVMPSNKTLFETMEQRGFLLDSGKEAA